MARWDPRLEDISVTNVVISKILCLCSKTFENVLARRGPNRPADVCKHGTIACLPQIEPSLFSDDGRSSEPSPQEIEGAAP